jgi:spermidine synthase
VFSLTYRGSLISKFDMETNYYAIRTYDQEEVDEETGETRVQLDEQHRVTRTLVLDQLKHSFVKGWVEPKGGFRADPSYTGYKHEQVQAEFARLAADRADGSPSLLIIGGGGYTLPRWADATLPHATVEVVEIDPGVTEIAHRKLGLPRETKIITYNMDGRQFVQERGAAGHYQLIVQDAVNDLSVPYHIMTKEYNDAIKRLLTPDGVYLLTVIDLFEDGLLMRAAVRTLRESFPHVELLATEPLWTANQQAVFVIYASGLPFDPAAMAAALGKQKAGAPETIAMPAGELQAYLDRKPAPVLTDAFAPVDNLISVVFRKRGEDDRDRLGRR